MSIQRRTFLSTAAAGAAGALIPGRLAQAAQPKAGATGIVPLGKHLKVTRIGFGTGMKGWMRETNQTRMGKEKFEALLRYAYDEEVRLFDMADLYGTHPYVRRAMKGKPRDSYALISKIWWRPKGLPEEDRPDADVCIKRFLKELETDYIDLVQLHCVTSPTWPKELKKQMNIMAKLKEKGLIRAHGVSVHSLGALSAAAAEPWVDVVHARVNLHEIRTDGPMDKVVPVLKKMHAAGKGIIGMKLIGEGQFGDDDKKKDDSVRFALSTGCIDAMIVGFEKTGHIDDFKGRVKKALA